jgi:hypothetical protein
MNLRSIGKGFRLNAVAAVQFMLWNWAHHVRFGYDFVVNWAWRDPEEQVRLLRKYYTRMAAKPKKGARGYWWDGWWWQQKGSVIVAPPGTSPHEDGDALDFDWQSAAEREWAHATASIYGFDFNIRSENWHADQRLKPRITSGNMRALGAASSTPSEQQNAPSPGTPNSPAAPAPVQQRGHDDMMIRNMSNSGSRPGWAGVIAPGFVHSFSSPENAETAERFYNARGDYLEVEDWGKVAVLANSCGIAPQLIPDAGGTLILKPNG